MAKRQHLIFGERCNFNLISPTASRRDDESSSSDSRILVLFVLERLVASMKWWIAVTACVKTVEDECERNCLVTLSQMLA
jgi:hypothetical protein